MTYNIHFHMTYMTQIVIFNIYPWYFVWLQCMTIRIMFNLWEWEKIKC